MFLAFLIPFVDVGISQSPMLSTQPDEWAHQVPGYGPTRLVLDGALTSGFDGARLLAYALAWLIGIAVVTAWVWRRTSGVSQPGPHPGVHAVVAAPTSGQ